MSEQLSTAPASEKSARDLEREKQVRQAEELLYSGAAGKSVVKELFHGRFASNLIFPYPQFTDAQRLKVQALVGQLREFCDKYLDPVTIDRQADIPRQVIDGLSGLGILGLTAPEAVGGRGLPQMAYCRVLEEIASRCGSTAIFVNAHHSIGMHALLLFGTESQQKKWLPDMVAGRKLAAFALTETQAGSDAGNVQTMATPSADGTHYVLNGDKRYITNGAIADVLTVMARTPVPGKSETAVTAFLVTPDMPGFQVVEPRMEKLGVRGTATAKLAFKDMPVPKENILGPLGKGLKVALTVLDFGRVAFGASCTGAAKTCVRLAIEHARTRVQFGRTLGEFPLVQEKLARMAAATYAMEAMTTFTAGLIDRRLEDYMLETAILKVYTSEALWTIVNDAFQIHGGSAYFTDRPLERMLRDARINQIGEGANEVMTSFIALVGMREPGERLRSVWNALAHPFRENGAGMSLLGRFAAAEVKRRLNSPRVQLRAPGFASEARRFSRLLRRFGLAVQWALIQNREEILERQLVQEPIAVAGMELYASACVLSRIDAAFAGRRGNAQPDQSEISTAKLFLSQSARRCRLALDRLADHDGPGIERTARRLLQTDTARE
jgi:acyl-CoA dehydrogenase family member 9